ncbi:hypothetical protein V8F20_006988 [Naviculisporaceae sp. PSN 640]
MLPKLTRTTSDMTIALLSFYYGEVWCPFAVEHHFPPLPWFSFYWMLTPQKLIIDTGFFPPTKKSIQQAVCIVFNSFSLIETTILLGLLLIRGFHPRKGR